MVGAYPVFGLLKKCVSNASLGVKFGAIITNMIMIVVVSC